MQFVDTVEIAEVPFVTAIMSDPEEPQQLHRAWFHEDPQEQEKWRQVVRKELGNMLSSKVWDKIGPGERPQSQHLVGCK